MKNILSLLWVTSMLFALMGCGATQTEPNIHRSFLAGYQEESTGRSSRILLNLLDDGTAEFYVGQLNNGSHSMESYTGTYTLGENDSFDETISLNDTSENGIMILTKDAAIVDAIFEMEISLPEMAEPITMKFYETAPVNMEGEVYVGYLTKSSGMGPMVYAYALSLQDDATFDVSIMQMAAVMHVFGSTQGTYAVNGQDITFTYDILTDEGEVVSANETAVGTGFDGTTLTTAFNIQQATMRASDAPFIKVK